MFLLNTNLSNFIHDIIYDMGEYESSGKIHFSIPFMPINNNMSDARIKIKASDHFIKILEQTLGEGNFNSTEWKNRNIEFVSDNVKKDLDLKDLTGLNEALLKTVTVDDNIKIAKQMLNNTHQGQDIVIDGMHHDMDFRHIKPLLISIGIFDLRDNNKNNILPLGKISTKSQFTQIIGLLSNEAVSNIDPILRFLSKNNLELIMNKKMEARFMNNEDLRLKWTTAISYFKTMTGISIIFNTQINVENVYNKILSAESGGGFINIDGIGTHHMDDIVNFDLFDLNVLRYLYGRSKRITKSIIPHMKSLIYTRQLPILFFNLDTIRGQKKFKLPTMSREEFTKFVESFDSKVSKDINSTVKRFSDARYFLKDTDLKDQLNTIGEDYSYVSSTTMDEILLEQEEQSTGPYDVIKNYDLKEQFDKI